MPNWSLSEEQKAILRQTGPEIEQQRLELLRGRHILIIEGSYPGKRFMYEHARALGIHMTILDGPGHWAQKATEEGLFERFIEVDLAPAETLADRAYAAIRATGERYDAIASFEDAAGPLVALLAKAMGLPGHPVMAVGFSRNKIFTREVCVEAGIPSPRFYQVRSAEDLDAAAAHVGFPAVLKPISGASSSDVYRVENTTDLHRRYAQVMAEAALHVHSTQVNSDKEPELVWANGLDMTLEEFLDGEEFDVDMQLSEGQVVYCSVIRDLPQTYMIEVGSQMPPDFPQDKQDEMAAFAGLVLEALGFENGAFHVEVKYTSNGPRLVEVNARLGGGELTDLHRRVWGVDVVGQYLMTCLGIPIRPYKPPQPLTCIITNDMPCPYSGTVTRDDYLDVISNHPQVLQCETLAKTGQFVRGPDLGVPEWLAMIMVCGPTIEAASRTMDELLSLIEIPIARGVKASEV